MAEHIASVWQSQGLSSVRLIPYHVLLSYPDPADPNRIVLLDIASNKPVHTTQLAERVLRPEQNQSDVVPPFNVFSPPGNPRVRRTLHFWCWHNAIYNVGRTCSLKPLATWLCPFVSQKVLRFAIHSAAKIPETWSHSHQRLDRSLTTHLYTVGNANVLTPEGPVDTRCNLTRASTVKFACTRSN